MKDRKVIPEILDSLPAHDPDAQQSRRDLRRVNALMGNYRWGSSRMKDSGLENWWELGAGDGSGSRAMQGTSGGIGISAVDFAPRPVDWPEKWEWKQGDLFDILPSMDREGDQGVFAVLFLHHFKEASLERLGKILEGGFSRMVFVEPARFRGFWLLSHALLPWVNRVTRHDMLVSIGAGFRVGELTSLLGLGPEWQTKERVHWLGGLRFEAWREVQ